MILSRSHVLPVGADTSCSKRWACRRTEIVCQYGILTGLFTGLLLALGFPGVFHHAFMLLKFTEHSNVQSFQMALGQVGWDNYSLILQGKRVFLHSGEFHTFRLPSPSLWNDILQKAQAAGLNAISVYTHWGLINPSPGMIDFDGFRSLQWLYEAAKAVGIWVVLRPGPYINAETTAGGIPHWVTSQVNSTVRTNATDFHESWQNYIHAIINQTLPFQITEGGPVIAIQIDNEYFQTGYGQREYFAELEDMYRKRGIMVPLTYNDAYQGQNFVNGTGAVDIYGLDSYPQGFDCSSPEKWNDVVTTYRSYHQSTNPTQPLYIPEFQAGSYDAWGPNAPGYGPCRTLTGPDFQSVFNLHLWASNAKMINYYMFYGGTSWGGIPFPGVYTSYDYGAPVAENRALTDKYSELKRQGLFLRSSPEFYKTDWLGDTRNGAIVSSNPAAYITHLRNPDSDASFYIARNNNATSRAVTEFMFEVTTSVGLLKIPRVTSSITIGGRQSKIIVVNYAFGSSGVLYSTAQIFFAGVIGGRDVLFLYGDSTQAHEVALILRGTPRIRTDSANVQFVPASNGYTSIAFLSGIEGLVTIWDSDNQLILFSDTDTTTNFFSPVIPADSSKDFAKYFQFGTNDSILVGGPYLVRSADMSGPRLALRGDLEKDVRLIVIAPDTVKSITWNDETVFLDSNAQSTLTSQGGFIGHIQARPALLGITVPPLTSWKYADSLPEITQDFSDDTWTVADRKNTNIPYPPHYGDGRILYGCDYGFCENTVLWRGHFYSTGKEEYVNLSINGGEGFAASVWLNGVFLNTSYGNSSNNQNIVEETDERYFFPPGALLPGRDNVITVVQDNQGLNESDWSNMGSVKSPRGIRGYQLSVGTFSEWKVQGKIGGYANYPDRVRGVLNEGGLYGERRGWHLPGFDTTSWDYRNLNSGLPSPSPGIGFFVTHFNLSIPAGFDVAISFNFEPSSEPYRALLFVNGWMMGKLVANLGPQFKFPVQQGILDYNGQNTVAVALWVMEPDAIVTPNLQLSVDRVFDGGMGDISINNPAWSAIGRETT